MPTITIQNFRNIKFLELKDLETINVIVGDNGVGKSSVLHAIMLLQGNGFNIDGFLFKGRLNNNTQLNYINAVETLFNDYNIDNEISISLNDNGIVFEATIKRMPTKYMFESLEDNEKQLLINSNPNSPHFLNNLNNMIYLYTKNIDQKNKYKSLINSAGCASLSFPPLDFQFIYLESFILPFATNEISHMLKNRTINILVEQLKLIDENVEDITVLPDYAQDTVPYIIFKGVSQAIPFYNLSNSLKTALNIFPMLLNHKNQYILLDEFESSIYFKRLTKVLKAIYHIAKEQNHRIIIASHSSDLAKSIAYLDSKEEKLDICGYYLSESRKTKGKIFATKYSSSTINQYIANDYDIRGYNGEE